MSNYYKEMKKLEILRNKKKEQKIARAYTKSMIEMIKKIKENKENGFN